MYTHVNEKGPCGILVNRGFLPFDYFQTRQFLAEKSSGYFEGILYCGDIKCKYDKDGMNSPHSDEWRKVYPEHLALTLGLKNRDDAELAMLMFVDFDEEHPSVMPAAHTAKELCEWKNPPERHNAYHQFWKYTTYFNLFANTMFWLYF